MYQQEDTGAVATMNGNGNAKAETHLDEIKPSVLMTRTGFAPRNFDEAWRFAKALAVSKIVPQTYQNSPENCFIALDLACRLDAHWLAVMQHVYTVHDRPGMDAALTIGLVNRSGQFEPIQYEVRGEDVSEADYGVRAFSRRCGSDTVLYGPWITWKLVRAEGWDKKTGSKWNTMAEQMFHYRAGAWWQRRHCPEMTLGMQTTEELADLPAKQVESKVVNGNAAVKEKLAAKAKTSSRRKKAPGTTTEPAEPAGPADDTPEPDPPAEGDVADLDDTPELDPERMCICNEHGHKFRYKMAVFSSVGRVCPVCLDKLCADNTDWRPV